MTVTNHHSGACGEAPYLPDVLDNGRVIGYLREHVGDQWVFIATDWNHDRARYERAVVRGGDVLGERELEVNLKHKGRVPGLVYGRQLQLWLKARAEACGWLGHG